MVEIYPSILTDEYDVLERQVRAAEKFAAFLHIDLTDGRFVASTSITANDLRALTPAIPMEIHLMVERPEEILDDVLLLNPRRILLHRKAAEDASIFAKIRKAGCEAGLVLSPATHSMDVTKYLPSVNQVTFLTVDPGFQGGPLIPGVLQKVRSFRADHPEVPIEIDGGIRATNIAMIAASGGERFVIGSAFWESPDPAKKFKEVSDAFELYFHPSS